MARTAPKERKCFGQACTVAKALDVVGDRWTLLLVRELLGGPARFGELLEGLPGVARNLLASRLRQLEQDNVARRIDLHGTTHYALTEHGTRLRPLIDHLGYWGANVEPVGPILYARSLRSLAVALQAILSRAGKALPQTPLSAEVILDIGALEIVLGRPPTVTAGPASNPDGRITTTSDALNDYLEGRGLDHADFELESGQAKARAALLEAMDAMA